MNKAALKSLPDKPSELIALALHDFEIVEQLDDYIIDMGCWHKFIPKMGKCKVCFAGAVIASSLHFPKEKVWSELDSTSENLKILALDWFRLGFLREGFEEMSIAFPSELPDQIPIVPYSISATEFKKGIISIIARLQEIGQ